jgi:hypothetical protein
MNRVLAAVVALACAQAFAAGGHHAVDDAAILEPGQCEAESWLARARSEKLLHLGAGCRVGPVELGVASEYARQPGGSQTGWGLQAKWAHELREGLSIGAALSAGWAAHVRPRFQASTASLLATWVPVESIALHANLGRDFVHQGADLGRSGVGIEWTARQGWTLMAERYLEEQTHFARAGVRWAASDAWTLDLSRSARLRGPGESAWTLGATWQFGR